MKKLITLVATLVVFNCSNTVEVINVPPIVDPEYVTLKVLHYNKYFSILTYSENDPLRIDVINDTVFFKLKYKSTITYTTGKDTSSFYAIIDTLMIF